MPDENVIVCGHICCADPTSEAESHFHREEPFDCAECNRVTMAAGATEPAVFMGPTLTSTPDGKLRYADPMLEAAEDLMAKRQSNTEVIPEFGYTIPTALFNDIQNRFSYHPPSADQIPRYERIRDEARTFAMTLAALCPPSPQRDQSLLLLQNAVMMANAAIACNE